MTMIQPNPNLFYGLPKNNLLTKQSGASLHCEIPSLEISENLYTVRLAKSPEEIDAALRLRFEVFNLELGEGLEASFITQRDEDKFDSTCHHLIVIENKNNAVIGTYRLRTLEMSQSISGFYCAGEFELEKLPPEVLAESLEIGRACIAREYRNTKVLFLLWKGLAAYAQMNRKRYLFGCCSLTSQNPADGLKAELLLKKQDQYHSDFYLFPQTDYICRSEDSFDKSQDVENDPLPKLFLTYLRFGAKVCSPPAIDREFKTIDFFVIFDLTIMQEKHRRMFEFNNNKGLALKSIFAN